MSAISSTRSWGIGPMAGMNSSVVPSWSRNVAESASSSSWVDVLGVCPAPTAARAERRDREAAVAAENGGDAVQRRRAGGRVPQQLGVVVRVDVDEPGAHDLAGAVDGPARGLIRRADQRDAP